MESSWQELFYANFQPLCKKNRFFIFCRNFRLIFAQRSRRPIDSNDGKTQRIRRFTRISTFLHNINISLHQNCLPESLLKIQNFCWIRIFEAGSWGRPCFQFRLEVFLQPFLKSLNPGEIRTHEWLSF